MCLDVVKSYWNKNKCNIVYNKIMRFLWYKSCENLFVYGILYKLFGVVECYGIYVGFGYFGIFEFYYEFFLRWYWGCKYVEGNLEIINF